MHLKISSATTKRTVKYWMKVTEGKINKNNSKESKKGKEYRHRTSETNRKQLIRC